MIWQLPLQKQFKCNKVSLWVPGIFFFAYAHKRKYTCKFLVGVVSHQIVEGESYFWAESKLLLISD